MQNSFQEFLRAYARVTECVDWPVTEATLDTQLPLKCLFTSPSRTGLF